MVASTTDGSCHLVPEGCGFPAPDTGIFDFSSVLEFTLFGLTFHITKPVILLLVGALAVVVFFVAAFRRATVVPRGIQNIAEYGYLFVRDGIARDTIGKQGDKFVPVLFTFFFFVWVLNVMSIIPFAQFPVTSRFAIPVAFAVLVYLTWVPLGVKNQGLAFFKNMTMPPDVPKAMYVLLIPIEILSNFIVRPFTHSVRLFANMFAGHMLIVTFSVATWYLLSASVIGIIGSGASFVVTVALTGFEMLIQALQAYVFTLLAAVYINDAVNAH
ncbi:MAG: F0F1 ATP synthase subunit A [Frankiales bacterium]|nr:F0F1 ATP synthase subunit A [Frankiales bacterium]